MQPAGLFHTSRTQEDAINSDSENVAGIIHKSVAGTETMHFFFASSTGMDVRGATEPAVAAYMDVFADVPHGVPLGTAWFTWCSEGVEPPSGDALSTGLVIALGVVGV